ncbi:hypothetical protein [Planktothricoides raciborskii]|uniref:hypothetical protein n=1 Tax=Planktothricoides raciborskii TaxID=132608 RepID=UPI0016883024|nr:hypothetical protein [Planktothricoides raciborskii]MBD2583870.1 hypothetical protein [Planktothricoides raciborskii FACHB-1261]
MVLCYEDSAVCPLSGQFYRSDPVLDRAFSQNYFDCPLSEVLSESLLCQRSLIKPL